jgi:hypothetical protein
MSSSAAGAPVDGGAVGSPFARLEAAAAAITLSSAVGSAAGGASAGVAGLAGAGTIAGADDAVTGFGSGAAVVTLRGVAESRRVRRVRVNQ